jgi:hypothetical protein
MIIQHPKDWYDPDVPISSSHGSTYSSEYVEKLRAELAAALATIENMTKQKEKP